MQLDFAHIKCWRDEEASLRSVRKGLPRQTGKSVHLEAMPFADVPALMETLATASPTTGRDALRFTIYNAVRSNETRFAVWTEFDLDKAIWTIPGERMKAKETHVVPLSGPAVALLRRRWNERANDTGLVFSADGEKPMSDMTMTKLLRDGGIKAVQPARSLRCAGADDTVGGGGWRYACRWLGCLPSSRQAGTEHHLAIGQCAGQYRIVIRQPREQGTGLRYFPKLRHGLG